VEYPRKHDVSKPLEVEVLKEKFPDWFHLKSHAKVSRDLSKKKGPAVHDYEAELRPASDIFDEEDAAKKVFDACEKFIKLHLNDGCKLPPLLELQFWRREL